jgi:hypothetical protein
MRPFIFGALLLLLAVTDCETRRQMEHPPPHASALLPIYMETTGGRKPCNPKDPTLYLRADSCKYSSGTEN